MNPIASQILDGTPAPQVTPGQSTQTTFHQDVAGNGTLADNSPGTQKNQSPSFDLIAKMERRLKMREEEFKTKEQKMAEYEAKLKEYEGFDENPFGVLQKKGWDLEKLNRHALETMGDEELDPVARRFKEIEETLKKKDTEYEQKLKDAIAAKEKEIQEREQQYQIEVFKRELKAHIASKKDEYEFVNTHPDGPELVYDVIFADLQRKSQSGETDLVPMDYDAAAQKVEEYLYKEAEKYLSLNKVKSKFSADKGDWASLLKSEQPKTITQSFTPKSAIHPAELSEQERINLAIEGIKTGKWNV